MHAEYFTHQTLDTVAHHSTAQLLAYRQTDLYIFALIRENIKNRHSINNSASLYIHNLKAFLRFKSI